MACDHVRVRVGELNARTRPRAHIRHAIVTLPRNVPYLDASVVTSSCNLVAHLSEAEAVDARFGVVRVVLARRPHRVNVQLVQVVAGDHYFTPS